MVQNETKLVWKTEYVDIDTRSTLAAVAPDIGLSLINESRF